LQRILQSPRQLAETLAVKVRRERRMVKSFMLMVSGLGEMLVEKRSRNCESRGKEWVKGGYIYPLTM
jgi:hypothetical protein